MSSYCVAVWLDHAIAHVIHFGAQDGPTQLTTEPDERHRILIAANGAGQDENLAYFDNIVRAIGEPEEILITGPGFERLHFMQYLQRCSRHLAGKVVAVEVVDDPRDDELVAYARKDFHHQEAVAMVHG